MPGRMIQLTAAIVITIAAVRASAGPVVVPTGDPRGNEVRAVATEFWIAIADQNAVRAKSFFAGQPEQAKLIDAYIRVAAAIGKMRDLDRPEARSPEAARLLDFKDGVIERAKGPMILADDKAWIAGGGGLMFQGVRLDRIDGKWKITQFAPSKPQAAQLMRYLDLESAQAEEIIAALVAKREDDAKRIDAKYRGQMFDVWGPITVPPECSAAPPPTAAPLSTASALAALIGESFSGKPIQALIAQLPGLPRLAMSGNNVWIESDETGVHLTFGHPPALDLVGIRLTVEPCGGSQPYQGDLPFGIKSTDRRKDIEARFGPAPESGGGGTRGFSAYYTWLGVSIDFTGVDGKDPNNPIRELFLSKPVAGLTPTTAPLSHQSPRVAFRLVIERGRASDPGVEMLTDVSADPLAPMVAVSREVLLDENDIERVMPLTDPATMERKVGITMSDAGSRRLEKVTGDNIGRRMAIVFDGKILIAPVINSRIARSLEISMPHAKPAEVASLVGRLHAAINVLPPATQPSTQSATRAATKP
jgi:hypothetical protein